MKVAYITPGGSVHDDTWMTELGKYFEVVYATDDLEENVDIIQFGGIHGCCWMGLETKEFCEAFSDKKAHLVYMSWGYDVLEQRKDQFRYKPTPEAIEAAEAFLCDSDVVREKLLSLRITPPPPVIQLPWGVDLQQFTPRTPPDEGLFIVRERGLATIEKAFGIANESWFVPTNRHSWMPGQFAKSWAYACASPSDGSSVTLLEAMACGLPVIVSDIPGNREWVTQGVNGWLCKVGEPQSFADAIRECAGMTVAERKRMGEANRAVAEERADWPKNFKERVVPAYENLVGCR